MLTQMGFNGYQSWPRPVKSRNRKTWRGGGGRVELVRLPPSGLALAADALARACPAVFPNLRWKARTGGQENALSNVPEAVADHGARLGFAMPGREGTSVRGTDRDMDLGGAVSRWVRRTVSQGGQS